jgi:SET domain-containing protein
VPVTKAQAARRQYRGSSENARGPRLFLAKSVIHGRGVFSREFIRTGDRVLECCGILQHREEVKEGARAMQVGEETYLTEDPENPTLDDFLNHSCEPNLGFVTGSLTLYAIRDIERGEEVVFDYSTTMNERGWAIKCRCRAPMCRVKVQSYCDLPEWERTRLSGFVLAYLRQEQGSAKTKGSASGVALRRSGGRRRRLWSAGRICRKRRRRG